MLPVKNLSPVIDCLEDLCGTGVSLRDRNILPYLLSYTGPGLVFSPKCHGASSHG